MAAKKLKGNQCTECEKTHEECAGDKTCPKWEISLHVCHSFNTLPRRSSK